MSTYVSQLLHQQQQHHVQAREVHNREVHSCHEQCTTAGGFGSKRPGSN